MNGSSRWWQQHYYFGQVYTGMPTFIETHFIFLLIEPVYVHHRRTWNTIYYESFRRGATFSYTTFQRICIKKWNFSIIWYIVNNNSFRCHLLYKNIYGHQVETSFIFCQFTWSHLSLFPATVTSKAKVSSWNNIIRTLIFSIQRHTHT